MRKHRLKYPQKCPNCDESFVDGDAHILKYAVTGCQKLKVDEDGISYPRGLMKPSPMLCMCSSCNTRVFPQSRVDDDAEQPQELTEAEKPKRGRPRKGAK